MNIRIYNIHTRSPYSSHLSFIFASVFKVVVNKFFRKVQMKKVCGGIYIYIYGRYAVWIISTEFVFGDHLSTGN